MGEIIAMLIINILDWFDGLSPMDQTIGIVGFLAVVAFGLWIFYYCIKKFLDDMDNFRNGGVA